MLDASVGATSWSGLVIGTTVVVVAAVVDEGRDGEGERGPGRAECDPSEHDASAAATPMKTAATTSRARIANFDRSADGFRGRRSAGGGTHDQALRLLGQRLHRFEQLLHDAGDLRVGVRVVRRPEDLVGAEVLGGERERDLVGIEAHHALTREQLARQRRLVGLPKILN